MKRSSSHVLHALTNPSMPLGSCIGPDGANAASCITYFEWFHATEVESQEPPLIWIVAR